MTSSWHAADRDESGHDLPRAVLEDVPRDEGFSAHLAAAAALLQAELDQSELAKNSRRSLATRSGWVV